MRCIWSGCKPGDVVGGPGGEQHRHAAEACGLPVAHEMRTHAAKRKPVPPALWQAALLQATIPRLRGPQVVGAWYVADESATWGEAATPSIVLLTQYHSSMAAVLGWLTSTATMLPPDELLSESGVVQDGDRESTIDVAHRVRMPCVQLSAYFTLSAWQTNFRPGAAPAMCDAAICKAGGGRQGPTRHIPQGLVRRCRRQPAGGHHGAGAVSKLPYAEWRR